jgi:hypothetical protein
MTSGLQLEEPGMVDSCADSVRVRVLSDSGLPQRARSEAPVRSFDPYSTDIGALTARSRPRRSL